MKRHRGSLSATSQTNLDEARPQPAMIGRFLVEGAIGRGGMSDVYQAYDPQLARDVALKVLAPGLGRDPAFTDRFIRESRAAAQLNHPHVVPIFEAGGDGDTLFIAMQLVRGVDLKSYIETNGPLPVRELLSVISQAASALDHAHQNGLLHRDVKPANLMLEVTGEEIHVFLTDFGLTKTLGTDSRITHTGELVGSVHYVSPEHLEGRPVDERGDVYSLGCVLYECITGKPPFERDTDMAVLWAHLNSEVPSASRSRKDVPQVVDRVIRRAMAKDPAERFGSCEELIRSLEPALQGIAHDLPVVTRPPRLAMKERIKGSLGVAAAAAVLIASLVLMTSDWRGPSFSASLGERVRRVADAHGGTDAQSDPGEQRGTRESVRKRRAGTAAIVPKGSNKQLAAGPSSASAGGSLTEGSTTEPGLDLRYTRTERLPYDVRATEFSGVEACSADDTSAEGCAQFTLAEGERYIEVLIAEQTEFDVGGFIRQDYDSDQHWDGPWIQFCNETSGPVRVHEGARVQVWLDRQGCNNQSHPTIGTIVARFFRGAL